MTNITIFRRIYFWKEISYPPINCRLLFAFEWSKKEARRKGRGICFVPFFLWKISFLVLSTLYLLMLNSSFLKLLIFCLLNTANFYLASWYFTGRFIFDPALRERSLSDHASFPTSVSAIKRVRSAFFLFLFSPFILPSLWVRYSLVTHCFLDG